MRLEHCGYIEGEPVEVWVQFWRLAGVLSQIYWYIEGKIQWKPPTATGLPSAFAVPEEGHFHRTGRDAVPPAGFMYSGGLRPAPWRR